jgi:hypothetical protein
VLSPGRRSRVRKARASSSSSPRVTVRRSSSVTRLSRESDGQQRPPSSACSASARSSERTAGVSPRQLPQTQSRAGRLTPRLLIVGSPGARRAPKDAPGCLWPLPGRPRLALGDTGRCPRAGTGLRRHLQMPTQRRPIQAGATLGHVGGFEDREGLDHSPGGSSRSSAQAVPAMQPSSPRAHRHARPGRAARDAAAVPAPGSPRPNPRRAGSLRGTSHGAYVPPSAPVGRPQGAGPVCQGSTAGRRRSASPRRPLQTVQGLRLRCCRVGEWTVRDQPGHHPLAPLV